jgi:hypothetical protein
MESFNALADELLRDCPDESLQDHEAVAAAIRRGESRDRILRLPELNRWPETWAWVKSHIG